MTLIKVKNYKVLAMPSLARSVLRFIYEPKKMEAQEVDMMFESIKKWAKHFDYKLEVGFSEIDIEQQQVLKTLLEWLDMDSRGEFAGRKELIRKHGIDYRKLSLHRLPEAYTKKDFEVAQEIKKEYDQTHKEQEATR